MRKRIESFFMALAALCALGASAADEPTYYTVTNLSASGGTDTLTNPIYWPGGIVPTVDRPGIETTNFVLTGTVRTPDLPSSVTNYGHSLQLGTASAECILAFKSSPLVALHDGFRFVRGGIRQWYNSVASFYGPFTVDTAPGVSTVIHAEQSTYTNRFAFFGPISATASSTLKLETENTAKGNVVNFVGGLSADFKGKISCTTKSVSVRFGETEAADATLTGYATDGSFGAYAATDRVSIGTVKLAPTLTVPIASAADGSCRTAGLFRATKTLTVPSALCVAPEGILPLGADETTRMAATNATELTLLEGPAGSLADKTFTLERSGLGTVTNAYLPSCVLAANAEGSRLSLKIRPVHTRISGSDASLTSSLDPTWITNWYGHAAGDAFDPEADYLVGNGTAVREPDYKAVTTNVFAGRSLVFSGQGRTATLAMKSNHRFVVPDLATFDALFAHWGGTGVEELLERWPFATGGTTTLAGKLWAAGKTTFTTSARRHIRVESEISGSGDLVFNNDPCSDGNLQSGYLTFTGLSTNYTGRIYALTASGKTNNVTIAPSVDSHLTILLTDARNLGGERPTVRFPVDMWAYATIAAVTNLTLGGVTWGYWVDGQACFEPFAGATLRVNQPIRLYGGIHKLGEGTLVLGGEISFGRNILYGNAGVAPDGTNNRLTVHAGALRGAETNACEGLDITVEALGALAADAEDPTWGTYDVTRDTPLTSTAPDGKFAVRVVPPATHETNPQSFTAAICTVNATAAAGLAGKFRLESRVSHGTVAFKSRTNADGTTTFYAEYVHGGLMLIVR